MKKSIVSKQKLLFICLSVLSLLPVSAYAVPVKLREAIHFDSTVVNVVAQPAQNNLTAAYNALVEMTPAQNLTSQALDGLMLTTANNSLVTAINGANVHLQVSSFAALNAGTAIVKKESGVYEYPYRLDPRRPGGIANNTSQETITPIPEPATMVLLGLGALSMIRRKHSA